MGVTVMGKATLARQKAIGAIGPGAVARLDNAGLAVIDCVELADLKRRCALLRDLALGTAEQKDVAARILAAAMNGGQ